MAFKGVASVALVLSLNLLFFSMVSSNTLAPVNVSPLQPSKCPDLHICAKVKTLPPFHPSGCCPLIEGLADLDAAVCLCAALKVDLGPIGQSPLDILVGIVLKLCGRNVTSVTCE